MSQMSIYNVTFVDLECHICRSRMSKDLDRECHKCRTSLSHNADCVSTCMGICGTFLKIEIEYDLIQQTVISFLRLSRYFR
jgi:hypothetical protein